MKTRALGLLVVCALIAACGSATIPQQAGPAEDAQSAPADPCAESVDFSGSICPKAIALATARLGWLHWPITATIFLPSICPPNARCAVLPLQQGWVIFRFTSGDPVMIRVGPSEGADVVGATVPNDFVAADPEPVPDWLLDQMAGTR